MIPLKLQIKNFLSYGSDIQEVNFEPYSMICLSGKNGHGKSAMLDAMTWAIWGQARKINSTSKPDQGLLRLGQRQMMVIFDFAFNGQLYRVRREYTSAYGKQYAYLDFGIIQDNSTEITISLTGKTIRETQDKIIAILGLDYDAFINSAFLRQGQSNEFSKKSPKDRKEVLCAILGLDRFEKLKKSAFEKIKEFTGQRDTYLKIQQRIEAELLSLDSINARFLETQEQLKSLVEKEAELSLLYQVFCQDLKDVQVKIQESNSLASQINELQKELALLESSALSEYKIWKSNHLKLILKRDKKHLEAIKSELLAKFYVEQKKIDNLLALKNQQIALKDLEQNIRLENRAKHEAILSQKNRELESLNLNLSALNQKGSFLEKQISDFKNKLISSKFLLDQLNSEAMKYLKIDISKIEVVFERRKEFYQYLVNSGNLYTKQLSEFNKNNLVLDAKNPNCPLCMQNLSKEHIDSLSAKMAREEFVLKSKLARIKNLVPKLKAFLIEEHEAIKKHKSDQQELNLLAVKASQESTKILEYEKEIDLLSNNKSVLQKDVDAILNNIKNSLDSIKILELESSNSLLLNSEYQKVLAEIDSINKEVLAFDLVKKEFETLRQSISAIDIELEKLDSLKQEKSLQADRIQKISNNIRTCKQYKSQLLILKKRILLYTNISEQESLIKNKIDLLNKELKEQATQRQNLTHQKGGLEAQKQKLLELAKEHKDNLNIIANLDQEVQDFKDISLALGKEGIQALLIEEAIPEIESEANLLLSRLTDNQAQVFIESLRDLKKGGTKETLDIKISDSAGIRDYEMFSGGEAFRIDFAIRIAISKLLARRAGTSLQTLVIDEGFGSQDDEGLTNIMDCLYKIQADFEKIIIVSHLPSMKDQFPVHFIVRKGPAGSQVEVFEQG